MTCQHRAWVGDGGTSTVAPLALRDAAVAAWQDATGLHYTGPALSWGTLIPRQAGLSGSSALVIATLRALAAWADRPLVELDLARLAWRVETERLGITAGPQDRVIQALEGLLDMDFATEPWHIERLDPDALPPLLLSWPRTAGAPSGAVHGDLRSRFDADAPGVRETVAAIAALVPDARARFDARDPDWRDLFDRNLALRTAVMDVADDDQAAAAAARQAGAGAKLAGSGGAVIATAPDPAVLQALMTTWHERGRLCLVPTVSTAAGP